MRTLYFSTGSGRIGLNITRKDAEACTHPGPCDNDVAQLRQKPYIKRQLKNIQPEVLAGELKEYGAWDSEELANHEDNLDRIVWIACGDIADNNYK